MIDKEYVLTTLREEYPSLDIQNSGFVYEGDEPNIISMGIRVGDKEFSVAFRISLDEKLTGAFANKRTLYSFKDKLDKELNIGYYSPEWLELSDYLNNNPVGTNEYNSSILDKLGIAFYNHMVGIGRYKGFVVED